MNYKNFKFDVNNMRTLAPKLLQELDGKIGFEEVFVIMTNLSGAERKERMTVEKVRTTLNNPKMTDVIIFGCEMRFEWPNLSDELLYGVEVTK